MRKPPTKQKGKNLKANPYPIILMAIEVNVPELITFIFSVLISGSVLWGSLKLIDHPRSYDKSMIVAIISSFIPMLLVSDNPVLTTVLNFLAAVLLLKFAFSLDLKDAALTAVVYTVVLLLTLVGLSLFVGQVSLVNFRLITFS
ncbi:MAG: hypothetical protein GOV15_04585 [Candidatus Diapherotrites archaeon]|nr:hypothetical protein [Candidatus Diapherotrites archaeon]